MFLIDTSEAASPASRVRMSASPLQTYSGTTIGALVIAKAVTPGFGAVAATTKDAFSGARAWSPPV